MVLFLKVQLAMAFLGVLAGLIRLYNAEYPRISRNSIFEDGLAMLISGGLLARVPEQAQRVERQDALAQAKAFGQAWNEIGSGLVRQQPMMTVSNIAGLSQSYQASALNRG